MKFEVTQPGDPTEALGAYSGYRLRMVARRDAATERFAVEAFYRGSESMPEQAVPMAAAAQATAAEALELGYAAAVAWIDRMDDGEAASAERQG